jgi:hypothetical protein
MRVKLDFFEGLEETYGGKRKNLVVSSQLHL